MRTRTRTALVTIGFVAWAAAGCTKTGTGTITEMPSATTAAAPSTTAKADSADTTAKSDTTATTERSSRSSTTTAKGSGADPEDLITAALLQAGDLDRGWEITEQPVEPSRPEPGEPPEICPFTNDFYDGAVLAGRSAEFENGDEEIYDTVFVYESEAAAKDAIEVRKRDQEEECTRRDLRKSFESQGNEVVSFTQRVEDGPGHADEEVFTSFDFQLIKSGIPIAGGTLYGASRTGRVVVVTNYKNTAGPVGALPDFMAAPFERLRDAGAD